MLFLFFYDRCDFIHFMFISPFFIRCGVLTVEIEHVDAVALEKLEQQGIDCQPKASTIRVIQVG